MPRGFWSCAVLVVLVHVCLLAGPWSPVRPHAPLGTGLGAFQFRALAGGNASKPAPGVAGTVEAAPQAEEAGADQAAAPAAIAGPASGAGDGGEVFDESSFWPRSELERAPVPLAPVTLNWPAKNAPPAGDYRGELTLFIDEAGTVRRIRIEGADLPVALAEQARKAFFAAQFEPGQRSGQSARARIRVEVLFEASGRGAPTNTP